jgi:hypothetical protein
MSSQFSGSIVGSSKKSTIYVTGTAGLDNAAGYVKYNGSRKLSENEILNYIISREEKKDKLLMVSNSLGTTEKSTIYYEY